MYDENERKKNTASNWQVFRERYNLFTLVFLCSFVGFRWKMKPDVTWLTRLAEVAGQGDMSKEWNNYTVIH